MGAIFASDAAKWPADRDNFPCTAIMPVRSGEQGPRCCLERIYIICMRALYLAFRAVTS